MTGRKNHHFERMEHKEIFWMACDSTEQLRAEYGPFQTRADAEREARRLGFGFLLRYEHIIGEDQDIKEVRCVFLELSEIPNPSYLTRKLHTRCASVENPPSMTSRGRPKSGLTSTSSSTPATGFACSSTHVQMV